MKRGLQIVIIIVVFLTSLAFTLNLTVINSHADSEEELFFVAQKSFEDGFYDVSIRYINQFLESYPLTKRKIEAQILLGQCYFFKRQYLKAYDIFNGQLEHKEFKDATLFWLGETYLKGADYSGIGILYFPFKY